MFTKPTEGLSNFSDLHVPSVEEKAQSKTPKSFLGRSAPCVVLLPLILSIILLMKDQSFLKMDRWWMETIGDLLIHMTGEYNFPFGSLRVRV